ncbi:uncharacterized protein [Typha latifolia]|uniref:uncharacterized protein n=1 Tax=Typha latifolia TaxID=4733 RepID=UPI003C30780A
MGVVIEREEWELNPLVYVFLFASCLASIFFYPYFSKSSSTRASTASYPFDLGPTAPFLRFQRSFLLLYSLVSVIEGIHSVFGEYEYVQYGLSREQMVLVLAAGAAAALFIGTFSGILSDVIGARKACTLYCILHLLVGVLKSVSWLPNVWVASVCLAIASSIFSFCFETWMVTEHEKQGHKQDMLGDTFWLMTFCESASLVGSQGLANLSVKDLRRGFSLPYASAALLAIIGVLYIRKEWKEWSGCQHTSIIGSYRKSFSSHVLQDKKIWTLAWAQGSIHFSLYAFWFLWAPTIVADGREVQLSQIYPCFIGSRMLGSTGFPWSYGMTSPVHNEDTLTIAYIVAGMALSIVAYDYQEIGVLVIVFCIFHACVGFILPSLARLRTMYLPNELRGGMISLSLAPANSAILLVLIEGGYHRKIENSTIMALAAFGLFSAGGCIHMLRWWRKHPRQNWHDL